MGPNPELQPRIHWTRSLARARARTIHDAAFTATTGTSEHTVEPQDRDLDALRVCFTASDGRADPLNQDMGDELEAKAVCEKAPALRNTTSPLQHEPPPSTLRIIPSHSSTDEPRLSADPYAQVKLEIGEEVKIVSEHWIHSLYKDLVDSGHIQGYLASETSGYHQNGQWVDLLHTPASKKALSGIVSKLVSCIISELAEPCEEGESREVVDSHAAASKRIGPCPDISIKAAGPSFQRGKSLNGYAGGVSYSNLASLIDVELDDKAHQVERVVQAALYCKYISMMQPNRNFIRTLLVTERSFRLVHYDRSGFYVSQLMDIHQNAHTFIRIVLGLSSRREAVLGFDTSIQWRCDPETGRKSEGTLETVDADGQPILYKLKMDRPPFVRTGLCGRGTTCWYATHPQTGEDVLVKDAWREDGKASEYAYLTAAQSVEGVVQMISFQDLCAETKAYRPEDFASMGYVSRTKSRVVMRCYGKSLEHFTSRIEAISALRDAIHGYRGLLSKSVLHRDVSLQNVLLGTVNAAPGSRGILIDLDMAVWTHTDISILRAETGIGTRRFQSISVLRSLELELPPAHDYLDDLESFFYVLCHLVLLFERPGKRSERMDANLVYWESEDASVVANAKGAVLYDTWECPSWWGEATNELFCGFQDILVSIVKQKNTIRTSCRSTPSEKRERLEAVIRGPAGDVYDRVLQLFDNALAAYEREGLEGGRNATATLAAAEPSPAIPSKNSSSNPKPTLQPIPTVDPVPNIGAPADASEIPRKIAGLKRRSNIDAPDDLPSKRNRLSPAPTTPKAPTKRQRGTRPKASPAKAVRRSARLKSLNQA